MESEPFTDVLGAVYIELVSRWGKSVLGQYFTPQPVARMMAAMTIGNAAQSPASGQLIRMCDPAVGSGVMMLSALQFLIQRHGVEALRNWSITGIDLDSVCARMFALQIVANCAIHKLEIGEVVAYQGNALGPPEDIKVVLHATAPTISQVVPALHPARIASVVEVVKQHQSKQLSLFGEIEDVVVQV